jgi:hypothetical protein
VLPAHRGWRGRARVRTCRLSHSQRARPQCARVDSNHHGENSPQGPQPHTPVKSRSARVQIVRFVRDRGRIGHIGRNDLCQRCATPKLCQVDPSPRRASQCRTRFRTEHSFDSVFTWPSSLRGEVVHRQSPACHNDRREAEAAGSTTPAARGARSSSIAACASLTFSRRSNAHMQQPVS